MSKLADVVIFTSQVLNGFIKKGRVLNAQEVDEFILQELEKNASQQPVQPAGPANGHETDTINQRSDLPDATVSGNDSRSVIDDLPEITEGQATISNHSTGDGDDATSGTATD